MNCHDSQQYINKRSKTSQTPRVSVCQHCSIMFLFMMWTSLSHLTRNSWWPRVGGVGVGCPPPHCSSHQPSWLQLSSETKLTSIAVCQHCLPSAGIIINCSASLVSNNQIGFQVSDKNIDGAIFLISTVRIKLYFTKLYLYFLCNFATRWQFSFKWVHLTKCKPKACSENYYRKSQTKIFQNIGMKYIFTISTDS